MLGVLFRVLLNSSATNTAVRMLGQTDVANASNLKALVLGATTSTSGVADQKIDPRIEAHYHQHIRPHLDEFEANRVAALGTLRTRLMLVLPIVASAILFGILGAQVPEGQFSLSKVLGTLCMVGALAGAAWASWPVLQYKGSIKERIFSNVFSFYGPEWQYNPSGIGGGMDISSLTRGGLKDAFQEIKRISEEKSITSPQGWQQLDGQIMLPYMGFSILPTHEDASTEDYVGGNYKTVPLSLFECRLTSTSGSGKNRHTTVHFEGLVITLEVPKRFTGHTVIKRDKGSVGNWFGKTFAGGLTPVKLEDPRFEERYEVYGTDQIEARYLLNPAFMERLIELEDLFAQHQSGNCSIQCAFKDGKLLFAIPTTKEWFATGSIFKPANFIDEINQILKEMDQLFAIIDVLKLDDRTGL
jgi:hypothetical protein